MPGFLLHVGAVLSCAHGGIVSAIPVPPRVLVSGAPVLTAISQLTVAGCTFTPQDAKVLWANAASRVLVNGQPALLQAPPSGPGNGTCLLSSTPPVVTTMQVRVSAS
jgi:hypothetical protein